MKSLTKFGLWSFNLFVVSSVFAYAPLPDEVNINPKDAQDETMSLTYKDMVEASGNSLVELQYIVRLKPDPDRLGGQSMAGMVDSFMSEYSFDADGPGMQIDVLRGGTDQLIIKPNLEANFGSELSFMSAAQLEGYFSDLEENLSNHPQVKYVEPNYVDFPQRTGIAETTLENIASQEALFNLQWDMLANETQVGAANIIPAITNGIDGSGVVVAVLDTGILSRHPEIKDKIVGQGDFVSNPERARDGDGRDGNAEDEGDFAAAGSCGKGKPFGFVNSSFHGSHVAGTVAASLEQSGIVGTAPGAKLWIGRVLGQCGGRIDDIAAGIIEASKHARVINLSLGGAGECTQAYQESIKIANANGAVVVVAAGNSNRDASGFRPANCDGVISVGAGSIIGGRSEYSNFGQKVDILAPGGMMGFCNTRTFLGCSGFTRLSQDGGILSLAGNPLFSPEMKAGVIDKSEAESMKASLKCVNYPAQNEQKEFCFGFKQGTSMAAPHVAGVAALILQANPDLKPEEVKSILMKTAKPFPALSGERFAQEQCTTDICGAGLMDAKAAVAMAMSMKEKSVASSRRRR